MSGGLELRVHSIERSDSEGGFETVRLTTDRGGLELRYHRAEGATRAAVWAPGAGGGWYSPAGNVYFRLISDLREQGVSSLQIPYTRPAQLQECVLDVLAGLGFLAEEGVTEVALTGHSFGGAVVIQAAALSPMARAVIALSTQSYGAASASALDENCPLLAVHGTADAVLPPRCSEFVYRLASEPKRLVLIDGAGHGLEEAAEQVHAEVGDWIRRHLVARRELILEAA
jgi:hypothetical protein